MDVVILAANLGYKQGILPNSYLGFHWVHPIKRKTWNLFVERIHQRLAGWIGLYLSKRGKLTLIKAMLASLPTYFLSLFVIPASIAKVI